MKLNRSSQLLPKVLFILCCVCLLVVITPVKADNYLLHQGGTGDDEASKIIPGPSSGGLVIGNTNQSITGQDGLVMSVGSSWYGQRSRSFGGTGTDELYNGSSIHDDGVILCGRTDSFGVTNDAAFVLELDADQNMTSAFILTDTHPLWGIDIKQTSDQNYVLFANLLDPTQEKIIVTKFDGGGNDIWTTQLSDTLLRNYTFSSADQTADGGFIMCARLDPGILLVVKLDANGSVLWHRHFSSNAGNFTRADIMEFSDGSFYITGSMFTSSLHGFFAKLSPSGNLEWINAISHAQDTVYLNRLEGIYSDRIMTVGTLFSSLDTSAEILYSKCDLDGNLIWTQAARVYDPASEDLGTDIIRSNDGALYVCGTGNYEPPSVTDKDVIILRSDIPTGSVSPCDLVRPVILIQSDCLSEISVSQELIQQSAGTVTFTDVTSQVVVNQPFSEPSTVYCWDEILVPSMSSMGIFGGILFIGVILIRHTVHLRRKNQWQGQRGKSS